MYSTIAGTCLVNNLSTAIILFINQYQNHDIDKLTWKDHTVLKDMFCRNNKMHNDEHFITGMYSSTLETSSLKVISTYGKTAKLDWGISVLSDESATPQR